MFPCRVVFIVTALALLTACNPYADARLTARGPAAPLELDPEGGTVVDLVAAPNGDRVYAVMQRGTVRGWLIPSGEPVPLEARTNGRPVALAVTPDGGALAIATFAGTVELWDLRASERTALIAGTRYPLSEVVISPDGRLVVASHDVGTTMTAEGAFVTGVNPVQVWDTTTLEEIVRFDEHEHPVRDLAYAPDGQSIFSAGGGREGVVLQWEPRTGDLIGAFRGGSRPIVGVGVSQDGADLFAVDAAGKVMRWDVETGEGPATIRRAGGACRTFDVTADGSLVAIGTGPGPPLVSGVVWPPPKQRDDAVLLLDTAARETRAKLDYTGPVETLALSADGSILAAWSTGDVIRVWDVVGLTDTR